MLRPSSPSRIFEIFDPLAGTFGIFDISDKIRLGLIVAAGFAIRLYVAGQAHLTSDQLYSIWLARHPIKGFFYNCAANDVQAPLHIFLLHFWSYFSHNEIWLRLFSVILGALVIVVAYKIGIEIANKQFGIINALICSISPVLISYSTVIRYDALAILCASLSLLYFIRIAANKESDIKTYLWYTAWSTLLIFSFYYGLFFIFAQNIIWLLLKITVPRGNAVVAPKRATDRAPRWKYWIGAQISIILLFMLWSPFFMQQYRLAGNGGHEPPPVFSLTQAVSDISGAIRGIEPAYSFHRIVTGHFGLKEKQQRWSILFFLVIIVSGITALKKMLSLQNDLKKQYYWILPALVVFVILAATTAHYAIKLFFSARYFHFLTVVISVVVTGALFSGAKKITVTTFLRVFLFVIFLAANPIFYPSSYSEPWEKIAQYVQNNIQYNYGSILYHGKRGASIYTYYNMGNIPFITIPEDTVTNGAISSTLFPPVKPEYKHSFLKLIKPYRQIFVIWGHPEIPYKDYGVTLIKQWLWEENFQSIEKQQFGILPVEIYTKKQMEPFNE